MWFEILKKDLTKQKSVNIILFLFITLSTIFLASSVSNICVVMNGLKTYMDYANVSDVTVVLAGETEKEAFETWIGSRGEITEYECEQLCQIKADDVVPVKAGEGKEQASPFEAAGASLYLGYTGGRYAKPLDGEGNDLTLNPGEAALSPGLMERNGLQIGDTLQIKLLVAKISSLFARTYGVLAEKDYLYSGCLMIDKSSRKVYKNNIPIELNIKEYELLLLLAENPGKTLDKDFLFNQIWGADSFSENQTLTVHIKMLRNKIEENPKRPERIKTVWGVGYCYEEL